MVTFTSNSPEETQALGETLGRAARPGLVLGLSGELGTGKTQLVKGLARGLGISARVQSPTFVLVNIYPGGRLSLFHLDLYRLETPSEILAAGLEEYLQPDGVTVIEWVERWFGTAGPAGEDPKAAGHGMPADTSLSLGVEPSRFRREWFEAVSETQRCIRYEDIGA